MSRERKFEFCLKKIDSAGFFEGINWFSKNWKIKGHSLFFPHSLSPSHLLPLSSLLSLSPFFHAQTTWSVFTGRQHCTSFWLLGATLVDCGNAPSRVIERGPGLDARENVAQAPLSLQRQRCGSLPASSAHTPLRTFGREAESRGLQSSACANTFFIFPAPGSFSSLLLLLFLCFFLFFLRMSFTLIFLFCLLFLFFHFLLSLSNHLIELPKKQICVM